VARLIYSVNVTLDGCVDHTHVVADDEHHEYALNLLRSSAAVLLGRRTYELFADYWPDLAKTRSGAPMEVAFARELDRKAKYVASKQQLTFDWRGAKLLAGDLAQQVRALKAKESGDLVLLGSLSLARTLTELREIDEFHFLIQPMVAGQGPTLFAGLPRQLDLVQIDSRPFRSGVVLDRFVVEEMPPQDL